MCVCVCVCVWGGEGNAGKGDGCSADSRFASEHVETGAWRREISTLPTYRIMHA